MFSTCYKVDNIANFEHIPYFHQKSKTHKFFYIFADSKNFNLVPVLAIKATFIACK